ncbi:MAG: hypothetical protein AB1595_00850, partial [bacterium]
MDAGGSIGKKIATLGAGVCLFVVSSVFWAREAEAAVGINFISPNKGPVGTLVTIKGDGGQSTNDILQVDFGTTQTITTAVVDGQGSFTFSFKVGTQPFGTKVIT